jgi:hypothetical protein
MNHVLNFNKWAKLNENVDPKLLGFAQYVVGNILKAFSPDSITDFTDEQLILDVLKKIDSQEKYNAVLELVKTSSAVKSKFPGKKFTTVISLIETDFVKQAQEGTGNPVHGFDKEWLEKYQAILLKFNDAENFSVSFAS